jgi:polysaccharide biosynthesis/export protein
MEWNFRASEVGGLMLMRSKLLQIAAAMLWLTAIAFAGDKTTAPADNPNSVVTPNGQRVDMPVLKQRNPRYLLQNGDVMVLDFPFTPEFNATITVQPDGYVNLRGIDDMHVEGMTTPEFQQALKAAYEKILHDPVVTVTLQTFVAPYFSAYGEVGKPGKYDLHGDTTVAQAIAVAGGFTNHAKHSQVMLFRRISNDWVSAQKVDLKHMLKTGNLSEDLHLQPGDMLYVPKNTISKVHDVVPWEMFRFGYSFGTL